MVLAGIDDYTIMELVGHLTKNMLARYTHPVTQRKQAALESFDCLVTGVLTSEHKLSTRAGDASETDAELAEFVRKFGGRQEARTPDLRVANAALSQLS